MTEKTHPKDREEEFAEASAPPTEAGEETDSATPEAGEIAEPSETAERLAAAEEALAAEKDRFLRLYAEFENYKKRSAREIQDYRKYANETLIREILPIVDNLERAIQSSDTAEGDAGCIVQGVDMTLREILRVLEKFNVQPVKSIGEPFDPSFHEAVGREPSAEHPEGAVVREYQRGYLLHDRLVRPAMVVISGGAPAESPPADAADENQPEDSGDASDSD